MTRQFSGKSFVGLPIEVTSHALSRARERYRTDKIEEDDIKQEIDKAVRDNLVYDRKPAKFCFYGEKGHGLTKNVYVITSCEGDRAWIVEKKSDKLIVRTSIRRLAATRLEVI